MGHEGRPGWNDDVAGARIGGGRWARLASGVAGLALLAGVAACSPSTTDAGYSSSSYGSSTSGSSTSGSSTYGSSTTGASTTGASTSGASTSGASTSGASAYGSSTDGAYGYDSSGSSAAGSSGSGSSGSSRGGSYGGSYTNSDGQQVERPDSNSSGATAVCKDGTDSHSEHRSGTCSGHGGVREWL